MRNQGRQVGRVAPWMLGLSLLLATPALAATRTWSETPVNGNWSHAANWDGGVAPVSGDDLVFPLNSTTKTMVNDLAAGTSIGALEFNGNGYSISGNAITIGAGGVYCATGAAPNINTLSLPMTLGTSLSIVSVTSCDMFFEGIISGGFGLTRLGHGFVALNGANTFTGQVLISSGLLGVGHASGLGTADGTSATGTVVASGGGLVVQTPSVVNEALILQGGTGAVGSNTGSFYNNQNATWAGPITLEQDSIIGAAFNAFTLSGPIGGPGDLLKVSDYRMVLSGTNTFSGDTIVSAGTLILDGTLSGTSGVMVQSGATLGGIGTIAAPVSAASGATVAPGQSPGVLQTGNTSLTAGATFAVELNGTAAGSQYDQLNVAGAAILGGATLTVSPGFVPGPGTTFTILANDGADPVTGTFAGLAEGAVVGGGGQNFTISYVGGTGNDVVLTAAAPVPTVGIVGGIALFLLLATAALWRLRRHTSGADACAG